MNNIALITSLGLAIMAGAAVASSDKPGKDHRPHHSFEELDANGDGKVTREEMETHMQARFEGADTNGDGSLSRDELLARVKEDQAKRADKYVSHMIERHDANGDGALTMEEMRSRKHGKRFDKMDADGDGAISKAEFEAMRGKHKRHKHGDDKNGAAE